jgi:hypothetical protein
MLEKSSWKGEAKWIVTSRAIQVLNSPGCSLRTVAVPTANAAALKPQARLERLGLPVLQGPKALKEFKGL